MRKSIIMGVVGMGWMILYLIKGIDYKIMELNLFWWGMFTLLFYFYLTLQEDIKELKNTKKT